MRVDTATGLVEGVRYVASPNHDERPAGMVPVLLVIHAISLPPGEFGGPYVEQLFTNTLNPAEHPAFHELDGLEVSAHLFVRRGGEAVQFVPLHRRAWHAGESSYEGRSRVNDFSIGIELEGSENTDFEDAQYRMLTDLTHAILYAYPVLTCERILGHADIAPGRKTDPGPHFDWQRYLAACRAGIVV